MYLRMFLLAILLDIWLIEYLIIGIPKEGELISGQRYLLKTLI